MLSQVDHGEKEGALQEAALLDRTLTKGRCLNGPASKMGFGVAQNLRPDKRRALYYRRLELAMGMLRTISKTPLVLHNVQISGELSLLPLLA